MNLPSISLLNLGIVEFVNVFGSTFNSLSRCIGVAAAHEYDVEFNIGRMLLNSPYDWAVDRSFDFSWMFWPVFGVETVCRAKFIVKGIEPVQNHNKLKLEQNMRDK